jgi:hypothetical protein
MSEEANMTCKRCEKKLAPEEEFLGVCCNCLEGINKVVKQRRHPNSSYRMDRYMAERYGIDVAYLRDFERMGW